MTVRGVLHVHSAPPALSPHVEWAVAGVLGVPVSMPWVSQPAAPGMLRAELDWQGQPGMAGEAVFYNGRAISFELPTTVVRQVTYTEPAVRGDTSGKVLKPAKLATGFEVQVPAFCATGDRIEIDTRTHEYKRRVAA